jgi:hypothetical protein
LIFKKIFDIIYIENKKEVFLMKDIFVDLLLEGHSPEDLAAAMTEALHEVETIKAQIARDEALFCCVDAMNEYFGLVDPNWEPVDEEDVEAIAKMIAETRSAMKEFGKLIDDLITEAVCVNTVEPDPAPKAKVIKAEEEDAEVFKALFDFLNELGL